MAQRVVIRTIEIFFLLFVFALFFFVAEKYVDFRLIGNKALSLFSQVKAMVGKEENDVVCSSGEVKIVLADGEICRSDVDESRWIRIFDTYPKHANGREIVYEFLDKGDIAVADHYLENEVFIERYDSIKIDPITWEEDPYEEKYWRFLFYSLRETRHLLYAYNETGDVRYRDKLVEILESFIDNGMDKPYAWDDYHAVAFRSMVLTNTWWKLRGRDDLPLELSDKIVGAIQRHGTFLLDESHYEEKYNHGVNESIALWLLGINFPDCEGADEWARVGEQRILDGIDTIIDSDGILVENSPYYHLYALEKYWSILQYSRRNNMDIDAKLEQKVDDMIAYATYILQPDLHVPLLGASLERQIGNSGAFKEIADEYPEFLFVLTQGRQGKRPDFLNKYYPTAGQVIMRSGWEKKTKFKNAFADQTQVIFDAGPFRTDHSNLDALSFTLFSNGRVLLGDAGLYTYEETDALKQYFHGTAGHNTVMVDGKDQRIGSPIPGEFVEGEGYVMYSGQHNLYPQTYHQRAIALFGHDAVVIIDRMISDREHEYEQMFHTFSNAKTTIDGDVAVVRGDSEAETLKIRQLMAGGEMSIRNDPCSREYEKLEVCPTVVSSKRADNATFVTLLEIGDRKNQVSASIEGDFMIVVTEVGTYRMNLNPMDVGYFEHIKDLNRTVAKYSFDLNFLDGKWSLFGDESEDFRVESNDDGLLVIAPIAPGEDFVNYAVDIAGVETYYSLDQKIITDIPFSAGGDSFKVYEQEDVLPILGYHHVLSDDQAITSPTLEMAASDFERQIEYMTNIVGCRWYTFGDIMENYVNQGEKVPRRACVMNFDDGRKDHYVNGYRLYKKYGAVATFYIIAERAFGNNDSYMGISELDDLYRNGNEIGSHTLNAGSLVAEGYDEAWVRFQLEESKRILGEEGYKVTTFAYPRGEQTDAIVDLTKDYYVAGRDTGKDNLWRDRRTSVVGFDDEHAWHMHYFKPELSTPEDLAKSVWYNTWWQFEEGYRLDHSSSSELRTLSSYRPTAQSYAGVELAVPGDRISNKFIVSKSETYTIEVFGTVNANDDASFSDKETMSIFVDDDEHEIQAGTPSSECSVYSGQYYCFYETTLHLGEGEHILSIESLNKSIKVDKFRMYRSIPVLQSYHAYVTKIERISPDSYPKPIMVAVSSVGFIDVFLERVRDFYSSVFGRFFSWANVFV